MSTISEVLAPFVKPDDAPADWAPDWTAVEAALQEREDKIREDLHIIAMRLGTFPEFVAFAFAEVGLGTPPTPEAMEMLHRQFHERMAELQAQFPLPEGVIAVPNDQPLPEDMPEEVKVELRAARMAMGWCDHGRRLDECDDCRE